jgi:DNA-binding MarR family transcriptional regulator
MKEGDPDGSSGILEAVRHLYGAIERFDAAMAIALKIDRTCLRAINEMESGPIGPSELSRRLGLSSGSVTALLDRLEAGGHIERVICISDRRRRDADLTLATRHDAGSLYETLGRALESSFSGFAPEEMARAISVIRHVKDAFEDSTAGTNVR